MRRNADFLLRGYFVFANNNSNASFCLMLPTNQTTERQTVGRRIDCLPVKKIEEKKRKAKSMERQRARLTEKERNS